MKKILALLAFAASIMTASAVSLTWSVTGIAFGGSTLKSDSNLKAYLVYLGNNGSLAASYSESNLTTLMNSASSIGTGYSYSGTTNKGAAGTNFNYSDPSEGDYTVFNNDVFGILLTYVSSGKTYYNLSANTYKVTGVTDETSPLTGWTVKATDQNYTTASSTTGRVSAGGGWTAVPEPSTAALALAGLALLLKRRKA